MSGEATMDQAQKWGVPFLITVRELKVSFMASPNGEGGLRDGVQLCLQEAEEVGW